MYSLDPGQTALLVIDCQNDFCHPNGYFGRSGIPLDQIQAAVPRLQAAIPLMRAAGAAVIFVRTTHDGWTDSAAFSTRQVRGQGTICLTGSPGANFYALEVTPADLVVTKHRYSAFVGTNLDLVLRSRGIRNLLCTGFTTNVCVESTLRDGFMLDYHTVLIEDCCAAPTPAEHQAAIDNVRRYFGQVATAAATLAALQAAG